MRPSISPATTNDDFTPVIGRHSRHAHSAQHSKRHRLPPQDEHKQQRVALDDKPQPAPLPPSATAFSSHSPASSRRSSRASNPRRSSYDELDEDGDGEWDSGLTYEEKHNEASNSSSSRRQRVQSNASEYDGANEYDEYDDTLASDDSASAECPLCMETLDQTDLAFHPCMCGYQVCLYCLTGDHMVLTRSGWQSIKCIADGELVASYNIDTQAMEWKEAQGGTLCYAASASQQHQLFRMQSAGMDVVATRDHRMLVAEFNTESFAYSTVEQLLPLPYTHGAESAEGVLNSYFARSMRCGVLRSGLNTATGFKFTIPRLEALCDWWWSKLDKNGKPDRQKGFLQFVGFWLGDGHLVLDRYNAYVCIIQRKPEATEWLIQLLDEVFPHWWFAVAGPEDAKGTTWKFHICSCPPLVDWLREMAHGPQGYNPVDPAAMRSYPHFTYDPDLASAEAESRYRHPAAVGMWSEAEMLAAMTTPVLLPTTLPGAPLPPVVPPPLLPLAADGGELKTKEEISVTAATGEREYYVPSGARRWRSGVWQFIRAIRGDDAHFHCMRCGSDIKRTTTEVGTSNLQRHLKSELCRQGSEMTKDEQLAAALARQSRKRLRYLPVTSEVSSRASSSGGLSRSSKSQKTDNTFDISAAATRQRSASAPDLSAAVASVEATESVGLAGDMPLLEFANKDGTVARIPFAAGQVRWFYRPDVNLPVSSVFSSASSPPLPVSPAASAKEEAVSPSPMRIAPPASSSTPFGLPTVSTTSRRSRSGGSADLHRCGGVPGTERCEMMIRLDQLLCGDCADLQRALALSTVSSAGSTQDTSSSSDAMTDEEDEKKRTTTTTTTTQPFVINPQGYQSAVPTSASSSSSSPLPSAGPAPTEVSAITTAADTPMGVEGEGGLYQPTVPVAPDSVVAAPVLHPRPVILRPVWGPVPPRPAPVPNPAVPAPVPVPLLAPVIFRPGLPGLPPQVPNPNAVPIPAGAHIVPRNHGWWIIINGHWFYLKRWLGDQQQVAATFSHMSQKQAVALLDGFTRADGRYASVQYDEHGEPTGTWYCSNSSFPLIHHLMLVGQLAGAMVDLMRTKEAGETSTIDGREVRSSVDHWLLSIHFSPAPRTAPVHTVYLAQPTPADDIEKRGYWQYQDDGNVYCLTVKDNGNFLTQRLSLKRLRGGSGKVDVRAQAVFVGNCYNNILDNLNGQCPACRREYDRSLATTASVAQLSQPSVTQQTAGERKDRKRLRRA